MNYPLLSSLYYKDKAAYQVLYEQRFKSESAVHLPLQIAGHSAFFIFDAFITKKTENIFKHSANIERLCRTLPGKAITQYVEKFLIEEIMLTNNIEGIHSTRKEIKDSMAVSKPAKKNLRFEGLVRKYAKLSAHAKVPLYTCADIRALYDEIVLNEIDKADHPDGKILRKNSVSVYSVTDKEKHRGIYPETDLILFLENALHILNEDNQISDLVKIAVFHYLFGYAHPFYDGNGRTSRFISSYLLSERVHILICLRISYTIKNEQKKYYKAFEICNDSKNLGDITPFIEMFLDIIEKSAQNTEEKLTATAQKFEYYRAGMQTISSLFSNELQKQIVFIFIQNALFGDEGLSIQDISAPVKKGVTSVRAAVKILKEEKQLPIYVTREGNKLLYAIDLEKLDSFMTR